MGLINERRRRIVAVLLDCLSAPKAAVFIVVRNMNVHQYDSGRFPDSDFRSGQVVGPTLSHLLSHGDDISDSFFGVRVRRRISRVAVLKFWRSVIN